jgi:hypothetical protein
MGLSDAELRERGWAEWTDGLPTHIAMDVNADGDGPLDRDDPSFNRTVCWCGDDGCRKYPFPKEI